jgi:hypothetical protein
MPVSPSRIPAPIKALLTEKINRTFIVPLTDQQFVDISAAYSGVAAKQPEPRRAPMKTHRDPLVNARRALFTFVVIALLIAASLPDGMDRCLAGHSAAVCHNELQR